MAAQPILRIERRQSRQQHAARFAFVARQREGALQHVPGWQYAKLVAQLARAATAVEHGDHGVQLQPRIRLQAAEQTRQPGAAADTADIHLAKVHPGIVLSSHDRFLEDSRRFAGQRPPRRVW
jgi:hypothetical protein